MSAGLVIVPAVAAGVPLLLGAAWRSRVPRRARWRRSCCSRSGLAGADTPLAGRLLLVGPLGMPALGLVGAEHSMRVTGLVARLADTSAQIRVRLTVLLVAGLAPAAQALGFEAILGAFLAGLLVRAIDPDPQVTHPLYPVKLEAVG